MGTSLTSVAQNDPELLDLMLADESKQHSLYRPGPYWRSYQKRITAAIAQHGVAEFRQHADICKGFAYTKIRLPEEIEGGWRGAMRRQLCRLPGFRSTIEDYRGLLMSVDQRHKSVLGAWYELALRDIDLPETLGAGGSDAIRVGQDFYSQQYLRGLLTVTNFERHINFSSIRSVIEVGGGFGFWPHLLIHRWPNVRKIFYVDIPPMIYLATQYLKMFMPVRDYRQTRELDDLRFSDDDSLEV
jgi:putative sugar O-methyltransferase